MRKVTLLLMAVLACVTKVNAQQFVSTEPQNKNVIIEEFTGRNCGYCPDGHAIANQIADQNPGRVWPVNVHSGGYAPTSYPNFNTAVSNTYLNGFAVSGFPAGVVNRSTSTAVGRGQWSQYTNQELQQTAICNVGGQVMINPITRLATVKVEVYYTSASAESQNYLTVIMLQDSIWGSQAGGNMNPSQYVDGQYCHMHILRDAVTPAWGEAISPTAAGSLVTKEYTYQIPEIIGSPNGVEVDLENIFFLAFVTEKYQGTPTRPILNANKLFSYQGADEPIYPVVSNVTSLSGISCSMEKTIQVGVTNGGTDAINSLKFEVSVEGGETYEFAWEGEMAPAGSELIDMEVEVPYGVHGVTVKIVEANGEAFEFSKSISINSEEWAVVEVEGEEEEFTIEVMQDKYGNQITWELLNSDNTVLANGGPYTMLVGGSSATQLHQHTVTVPVGSCVKFVIKDAVGNGICCQYGEGYYQIKDSKGNVVVDGDGDFGEEAHNLLSVGETVSVEETSAVETYNIFPNPVDNVLTVKGENMKQVVVYNSIGQLVDMINCDTDEVRVNVSGYQNGMYFINVIDNNGEITTTKVSVLH